MFSDPFSFTLMALAHNTHTMQRCLSCLWAGLQCGWEGVSQSEQVESRNCPRHHATWKLPFQIKMKGFFQGEHNKLFIFLIECGHRQRNKDLLDMLMLAFVLGHFELFGSQFSRVIVIVPDLICLLCPWYMVAISLQQGCLGEQEVCMKGFNLSLGSLSEGKVLFLHVFAIRVPDLNGSRLVWGCGESELFWQPSETSSN